MSQGSHHRAVVELSSGMPYLPREGDQVCWEWHLANSSEATVAASFYLRTTPARLTALLCSGGRILRGHYHGSVTLHIPGAAAATVSALLEPRTAGDQRVRVALVTRTDVIERTEIVECVHAELVVRHQPPPLPSS
jgi:hypothetical protein